jgi:hypothetical protein
VGKKHLLVFPILLAAVGLAVWLARITPAATSVANPAMESGADQVVAADNRVVSAVGGGQNPAPKEIGAAVLMPPSPASVVRGSPYRNPLWTKAATEKNLEGYVSDLLNDSDIESPSFALRLKLSCIELHAGRKDYDLETDIAKFHGKFDREILAKIKELRLEFANRCGKLYETGFLLSVFQERIQQSRERGAVHPQLPYASDFAKGLTSSQYEALDKALRNPAYAALWITHNPTIFSKFVESAGLYQELNDIEKKAVVWLAVCQLGGDCSDLGIARLHACINWYLCKGSSVPEAVAQAVGEGRVQEITDRANQIAVATVTTGAGLYKPPASK